VAGRITFIGSILINLVIIPSVFPQNTLNCFGKRAFLQIGSGPQLNFKQADKPDKYFAPDKAKHFLAGMISTIFIYKSVENHMSENQGRYLAGGVTFSLGIAKEFYDKSRPENHFSWKDLLTDVVGIGVGFIILNQP
jgi:uncharacterized protein YfiM (DUF2279 family)